MFITINDREFEVRFGLRFLRELDKKTYMNVADGVRLGASMEYKVPLLFANDTVVLSEVLYTGTCTEKVRPTQDMIDSYIENHEDLEGLFEEVLSELKNSNATRLKMNELEKNLQAQALNE